MISKEDQLKILDRLPISFEMKQKIYKIACEDALYRQNFKRVMEKLLEKVLIQK